MNPEKDVILSQGKRRSDSGWDISSHLYHWMKEGLLILMAAAGIFLALSLVTYHRADPSWSHQVYQVKVLNAGGRVGAWLSDFLLYMFGYVTYIFPLVFFYAVIVGFRRHRDENVAEFDWMLSSVRGLGFIMAVISAAGLVSFYLSKAAHFLPYQSGGIIGEVVGGLLLGWFNKLGATVVLVPMLVVSITLSTGASWVSWLEWLGESVLNLFDWSRDKMHAFQFPEMHFSTHMAELFSRLKPGLSHDQEEAVALPTKNKTKKKKTPVIASSSPSVIKKVIAAPKEILKKQTVDSSDFKSAPRYTRSGLLPKLNLLDSPVAEKNTTMTKEMLETRSQEVEQRLADFGVEVEVVAVYPGPVVTRFEMSLAAGTKVSKITALAKDLARSLSVVSVRVVEVIPGKSVVGLELPNPSREVVTLKEVLSTSAYKQSRSALTLALGKDIAGAPVIVDLAKMPHLLVAGTTGSGKSVALNTMLLSLLYKSSPQDLRLILIDPKMLELSIYDGIPHLLAPVVTDMKDAASALRWCVVEMERRYRLMASLGVRNIAGYNQKVQEAVEKGAPLLDPLQPAGEAEPKELQTLPKIVVLADEFADMMVVVGKKVETLIARLAQKARAAGIHLIFATQRPSVDVITGLIKANIPTRIAFQVSSKIDSRTIIDQQGAEQLLGHGDMLYLPPGSGVPVRVHGCFASDDEVHRVVNDLKQRGQPDYLEDILDDNAGTDPTGFTDSVMSESENGDGEKDQLYDEAVHFIAKAQRVSVSSIQRRFKIGYNRAARIVEAMEEAGVVSKMEGNSQRDVLVPPPSE